MAGWRTSLKRDADGPGLAPVAMTGNGPTCSRVGSAYDVGKVIKVL